MGLPWGNCCYPGVSASFMKGESPLSINGLAPGEHRVRFIPQDCGPNFRANTVRFEV